MTVALGFVNFKLFVLFPKEVPYICFLTNKVLKYMLSNRSGILCKMCAYFSLFYSSCMHKRKKNLVQCSAERCKVGQMLYFMTYFYANKLTTCTVKWTVFSYENFYVQTFPKCSRFEPFLLLFFKSIGTWKKKKLKSLWIGLACVISSSEIDWENCCLEISVIIELDSLFNYNCMFD